MVNLFIILLIVGKSLQSADFIKEEKYCECYDRCQKNFPSKIITNEQSKTACERGCRFYSLVLHTTRSDDRSADKAHAKERCSTSCAQSYLNASDVSACKFGCSSMKSTDADVCAVINRSSQDVIEFLFDDSSAIIRLEEPEFDDVLIDIALKKQLQNPLESLLDPKPKIPEISFRNLPISKQERSGDRAGVTVIKCPRFYELYVKLALRQKKLSAGDLCIISSILLFAILCMLVNRYLEKHRKLWKQVLINFVKSRPGAIKIKDPLIQDEVLLMECLTRKANTDTYKSDAFEKTDMPTNIKYEDVTLVIFGNGDSEIYAKPHVDYRIF